MGSIVHKFHAAAKIGDVAELIRLYESDEGGQHLLVARNIPSHDDPSDAHALGYASANNHLEAVKFLLPLGNEQILDGVVLLQHSA
jgi:hypothetical protein